MFTSIRQVNEQFFRTFFGIKINVKGEEKTLLCRYARKSSRDYVEEQENQLYPCIAIQDYTPTLKREWYVDMTTYFGGKSLDGLKGYLYNRPIWMEFRYDVSIASKSYMEFMAMQDYFMENFVYEKRLVLNAHLSGEDLVGDIVPYEIRENYIPRTDGVQEINYEFTCSVWMQPKTPQEVDIVQSIIIRGAPKGAELQSISLTPEGKVLTTEDAVLIGVGTDVVNVTAKDLEEIKALKDEVVTHEELDNSKKEILESASTAIREATEDMVTTEMLASEMEKTVQSEDIDNIKVVTEEFENIEDGKKDPRTLYFSSEN